MILLPKELLHALWLNSDERVLLRLNPYREESTPRIPLKDILNMHILTTKRLFILRYYYMKKEVQITDSFYFDRITDLSVTMQNYGQKKDPLFYVAVTKRPVLSIRTVDKSYEIPLRGVLFVKKNINRLIGCVKRANPEVHVSVSYKKGDMSEAYREMLFEGVAENKRKRYYFVIVLVIIAGVFAFWHLFQSLRTLKLQ